MNDCLWFRVGACEGECQCNKYLSMNSADGEIYLAQYEHEVSEALKPVLDKWKTIFNSD